MILIHNGAAFRTAASSYFTFVVHCWVGLIKVLRRFNVISVISRLGSGKYPISEIIVARPGLEPRSSVSQAKHLTTTPSPPLVHCEMTVKFSYVYRSRIHWKCKHYVYSFKFAPSYFSPTEIRDRFTRSRIRPLLNFVTESFVYNFVRPVLNSNSNHRAKRAK